MARKYVVLFTVFALIFTLSSVAPIASAHNENWTLSSDYGSAVKIDGQISRGEWTDAHDVKINVAGGAVTVLTKAMPGDYPGGGRLYLCYIVPNDIYSVSFQWCSLHDLGKSPQADDRRIAADVAGGEFPAAFTFAVGTGATWQNVEQPPGFSGVISQKGEKTWIVEMGIPYAWLGIKICDPGPKGCAFDAWGMEPDGKPYGYYWPPKEETRTDYRVPDTWGNMVPSDCWGAPRGRLFVEKGPASPADHTWLPSADDHFNEMIQLILRADEDQSKDVVPEDVLLKNLTITATGSGNDQTDINNVVVFLDSNANGLIDSGESLLASGAYPADNGSITFTFPEGGVPVPLKIPVYLVIAYDMKESALPAPGSNYQFFVQDAEAWGIISGTQVPITGIYTVPLATHLIRIYLIYSAVKTIGQTPTPSGPSLSIQKIATADSVMAGEDITFNILVSNISTQTLYFVKVTDQVPDHTTFVDAPATSWGPAGSYDAGTGIVTWDLGNLAPGDWKLLRLIVNVKADTPDGTLIHNKAIATSTRPQFTVESEDEVVVVGGVIHEAYIKGYTGDLGSIFGPQRNVTRAEIAAIIARLLHLESTVTGQQFYSDVPASHWSFKYVEAVHRAGIMTGFPDGTFRPDIPATRANVAVAMIRARGIDPVAFLPTIPFPDIGGHWAIKEIETAYVLGIIEGLPDGTFHPDDPIIRAETVTLIDRALGRGPLLEGPVTQHFPDCRPTDWFYGWGEESFASHKGVRAPSGNERLIEYVDTGPVW